MFRRIALAVVMTSGFLGSAFGQGSPTPVGDWQGTISAGGAELRVVLHISKTDDEKLNATLDSIDQPGSNGIPVTSISLKEAKLTFSAASIHAFYEGKLSADGGAIHGTWIQGQPASLDFKRMAAKVNTEAKLDEPSDIDGAWMGKLDTGGMKLRIVFHFTNTTHGLTATMDSPDQNAKGMPATAVIRKGPSIVVEMKQIAGRFEGKIGKDLGSIDGTFTQAAASFPLSLSRVKDSGALERRRPQNPVPPYPYRSEDIEYPNTIANIKLAATFTIPKGDGPFPAVVLITGSGPQDRDEALLGHKPFLVLSDYLTRRGIAVLRTDDRGVGKSGGTFATSTTADFSTDTEAGVAYLKTRPDVNPHKIGLIGHSEGGVIAPMVAARNPDVAFIVMMAGTGVSGEEILVAQTQAIVEAGGATHEVAEKAASEERSLLDIVARGKDVEALKKQLRANLAGRVSEDKMEASIKQIVSPWYRYFVTYDPGPALRKVKCPVLVLNGEKDLQVPPAQNLPAIRKALEEGGNTKFEIDELPGLNHLFQTAKTGAPSEYADIEETISPVALSTISNWILKQ
jgi:pimeloyl-ACP methyl ester carboxylesterase